MKENAAIVVRSVLDTADGEKSDPDCSLAVEAFGSYHLDRTVPCSDCFPDLLFIVFYCLLDYLAMFLSFPCFYCLV